MSAQTESPQDVRAYEQADGEDRLDYAVHRVQQDEQSPAETDRGLQRAGTATPPRTVGMLVARTPGTRIRKRSADTADRKGEQENLGAVQEGQEAPLSAKFDGAAIHQGRRTALCRNQ
jgi:hypothetical protein